MSISNIIYNVDDYSQNGKHIDNTFHNQSGRCNCLNYNMKNGDFDYDINSIEFERCPNPVDKKHNFCEKHKRCLSFMRLFTNGYEPDYEPEKWNDDKYILGSHNCYAYFLNVPNQSLIIKCKELCKNESDCPDKNNTCQDLIPQPGDLSMILNKGNLKTKKREYYCDDMIKRITADNPKIKMVNFTNKCPDNYYKGAMVVDYKNTFHFYRLNKNGTWSHKPGITKVKTTDASKKTIVVPHLADRNYKRTGSSLNYNNFCGYFCLPKSEKLYSA